MKKLYECENVNEILNKCEKLRQQVWEDAQESAYYQVDDFLYSFRHKDYNGKNYTTLKDYSIDYCGAWVKVDHEDAADFLEDCETVQKDYYVFDDKLFEKIKRVRANYDKFYDEVCGCYVSGLSDKDFDRMSAWIKDIVDQACGAIATYAQDYYTAFDDESYFNDYFTSFWLNEDDDIYYDETNNTVVEVVEKRYAIA